MYFSEYTMSHGSIRSNSQICHLLSIFYFHLDVYIDYGKCPVTDIRMTEKIELCLHRKTFSNVIMANCRFILIKIKKRDTFRDAMVVLECPHSLNLYVKGRLTIALLNCLCFGCFTNHCRSSLVKLTTDLSVFVVTNLKSFYSRRIRIIFESVKAKQLIFKTNTSRAGATKLGSIQQ